MEGIQMRRINRNLEESMSLIAWKIWRWSALMRRIADFLFDALLAQGASAPMRRMARGVRGVARAHAAG